MCLYVSKEETEKFVSKHKNHKTVTVYKVLTRYDNKWFTPFNFTPVTDILFKANRPLKTIKNGRKIKRQSIRGGGIHCHLNYKRAYHTATAKNIFKCTALMEDLIAVGEREDVVFTKIKFPKGVLKQPTRTGK
jgi:hypothetical protein